MLLREERLMTCRCGKTIPDSIIKLAVDTGRNLRCSTCGHGTLASSPILKAVGGAIKFNGSNYDPAHDQKRLSKQIGRVYGAMIDGGWLTLDEIHQVTGDPQASISAQLRHLRKERFGSYSVEKRHRGEKSHGLYEYRLLAPVTP